ncbi:hypothetical protein CHS0354_024543 [Potamilus streckersoni]|uniref:Uncharacterized protein n=1 Tax=Potamilus streckersoni TaxID=2493646 RepID=A0AAE0WHJ1_9BIVA|nr:hypothetical protein CHS0354_024543 [Potamilus streckersoni]
MGILGINEARWTGKEMNILALEHNTLFSTKSEHISLNGDQVEEVENITYLVSKLTTNGDEEEEIRTRIFEASQIFTTLEEQKHQHENND